MGARGYRDNYGSLDQSTASHFIISNCSATMRLLNTDTLEIIEFTSSSLPPFAILSHNWGPPGTEPTFQDMCSPKMEAAKRKIGFLKIQKLCEKARQDRFDFAWADTCW